MQLLSLLLLLLCSHLLPTVPDDAITPGEVGETDAAKVCVVGYSSTVRKTTASMKAEVYREYGITTHKTGEFEVDHRIPLELGGADTVQNLWPQSYLTTPWNAHVKDRLENKLRRNVCVDHTMTLRQAQHVFRGNWLTAYPQFISK